MVQPPALLRQRGRRGRGHERRGERSAADYGRWLERMREFEAGSTVHLPALTHGAADRRLMEHSDHEAIKIYLWSRAGLPFADMSSTDTPSRRDRHHLGGLHEEEDLDEAAGLRDRGRP